MQTVTDVWHDVSLENDIKDLEKLSNDIVWQEGKAVTSISRVESKKNSEGRGTIFRLTLSCVDMATDRYYTKILEILKNENGELTAKI